MKKHNAIIYARVSTDEQALQGYSIESQILKLHKYCEQKGYNIVAEFKEDHSAKSFDRPEWDKVMKYITQSKGKVDKLVFVKWDRFSRNIALSFQVFRALRSKGVTPESVEEPLDLSVPESILMQSIFFAVPEVELLKISLRTKAGMRQASLLGCWVGKPPLGYDRFRVVSDTGRENPTLAPNGDEIIVQRIFELYIVSNLSAESIRTVIKKEFGKKMSKQSVLNVLTNYCYIGKVRVKSTIDEPEQIVNGLHQPIISDEVFNEAYNIMNGKRRPHQRKDNHEQFPLKEKLKCSVCGLPYTASVTTKNQGKNKYPYYHCCKTKGHDRYPRELVHTYFETLLQQFKVKDEVLVLYEKVLLDTISQYNSGLISERDRIEREIQIASNRKKRVQDLIADSDRHSFDYLEMLIRYEKEENELIMSHATLKAEAMPKTGDVKYLIELFNSFDLLYKHSEYPLKKKIVSSIFPNQIEFLGDYFRTEAVSPLLELLVLNSNNLQQLKIKTSHFNSSSSTLAPPSGLEPETL